jgi:hypothetical protein
MGIKTMSNVQYRENISNSLKGEKNHFFGKQHSQETKDIIREKARINSTGSNNPMYGKSVYDVWVKKYGKEIADKKMVEYKLKQSINSKGKNNPMYGKPTPQGSGNGWSGWYKNYFFRSIEELSYIINVLEKFSFNWKSAENIKIKYLNWENVERTYVPDFIVENKYLVEIKPKRLQKSPNNLYKKEAAVKYCYENNLKYKLTNSPIILSSKDILELYLQNKIIFTKRYDEKFRVTFLVNSI